jgi:hypothetical protein
LRYVKNISNWKVHIVDEKRIGLTLCGQFYNRVGFIQPIEVKEDTKIDCKSCLKKI